MNSVADNSFLTKWTTTEAFAKGLVGDIMNGKTGMIYRGTNSLAAKYLPTLLPQSVLVSLPFFFSFFFLFVLCHTLYLLYASKLHDVDSPQRRPKNGMMKQQRNA